MQPLVNLQAGRALVAVDKNQGVRHDVLRRVRDGVREKGKGTREASRYHRPALNIRKVEYHDRQLHLF
jgi:hypothetical protein